MCRYVHLGHSVLSQGILESGLYREKGRIHIWCRGRNSRYGCVGASKRGGEGGHGSRLR